MQRGAPRGLSFSLPPSLSALPSSLLRASFRGPHEKVRSVEACYRWTYVSIDGSIGRSSPHRIPHLPLPPRAAHGPSSSRFSVPLGRHRDYTGAGEGDRGTERSPRASRCSLAMGLLTALSFVSLFMKSRGRGGAAGETGRTEIESPRDLCRTCGIN